MKLLVILCLSTLNSFAETIYITGSIESQNTQRVLMPLVPSFNGKISDMAAEGSQVKTGDFLLRVDGSSIDSQIETQIEQLEVFKATAKKNSLDLKIQLNQAQIAYEKANINKQIATMKAQVPLDFIGELAYKQNQLQLKNTEKSLQKATADLQEVKLKIRDNKQEIVLGVTQKQQKLDYLQETLSRFSIHAQQDGYVIYSTKAWTGEKIQTGDQMQSGSEVMSVSQNANLQIIAYINAIDIPKLHSKQKVNIQFDAYLGKQYQGKIIQVASGGEDKQVWGDALYYKTVIKILDKAPENLLLGMSALIEIKLEDKNL
ncbi:hypothetical protein MNBD_GAMMA01-944 [hydrothermal vent metagenome]|uniref:YknX-like beta-barrel domain-containing protein n=1 Tax=hydrothermal vent metagenome TaxID=652676 RepID=A0A3B0VSH5_9ZZZZ